jgi:cyclic pyranopterin phosphate synthase
LPLTGQEQLAATLSGIDSALAVGLSPVKINVALTSLFKQEDLDYFIELVYFYPLHVRFIEYMPIGDCQINPGPTIEALKIMINLAGKGVLIAAKNVAIGNGSVRYYKLPRARGMFGFITSISEHFCYDCNRLRLTADGKLKPCLLSNQELNIKTPLRDGAGDKQLMQLFWQAVSAKPSQHSFGHINGHIDSKRHMSQIGG